MTARLRPAKRMEKDETEKENAAGKQAGARRCGIAIFAGNALTGYVPMNRGGRKMRKKLSARECDVARLLVKGISNKEIARALGIEVVTVKMHVGRICRKMGGQNRTQAALVLAEDGGRLV